MPVPLPGSRALGFTLAELVMTITIIAILGALVGPRLMSATPFQTRGFYDEAQAVVRYAQKTAIARRRTVFVCVTANEIRATTDNTCGAGVTLPHPLTTNPLVATSPPSVTLALTPPGAFFSFDGLGRASGAMTITFTSTVTGDPARVILVAAETGYVSR